MSNDLQWRPRLHKKSRLRSDPLSEKEVLLLPEAALILNDTAAMVLRMCDGCHTLADIIAEASQCYRSDAREHITADLLKFLDSLRVRGLVQ